MSEIKKNIQLLQKSGKVKKKSRDNWKNKKSIAQTLDKSKERTAGIIFNYFPFVFCFFISSYFLTSPETDPV